MLKIGNLTLAFPYLLAPMAGVSDLPFRLITRSFGVPLAFAEMIDARAIARGERKTRYMLTTAPEDRPLGVQFLGHDETDLVEAVAALEGFGFDLLDLNAACPTPKVTRKGKGAALLKDPSRLGGLLKALVSQARVPVTVKIRAGWDPASVNAREVALRAEDAGISALFIHGRTRSQGYGGTVDYRIIQQVKAALTIPVIASGDNLSVPAIKRMFDETGCDGVTLARGSLGYPWLCRELNRFFEGGLPCEKPTLAERLAIIRKHLDLIVAHYGEKRGVACFHKFFIWYTRGLRGTKPLRDGAFRADTRDELDRLIEALRQAGRESFYGCGAKIPLTSVREPGGQLPASHRPASEKPGVAE